MIITILGTRPQFIKHFPIALSFKQYGIQELVVDTGQHWDYEMSKIFVEQLGQRPPDISLRVSSTGHAYVTSEILRQLEDRLSEVPCDAVLVIGDTNSTLAGALWAAKRNIPVAHVEAGLRSFDRSMPEELNRVVVDHLSSLLFCPTTRSMQNLGAEGLLKQRRLVGDVLYDAVLKVKDVLPKLSDINVGRRLSENQYSVLTVHRQENTSSVADFNRVLEYVKSVAETPVIFPIHPRTRALIRREEINTEGFELVEPVGYLEILALISGARRVFTDSGGVQKEAYFLRTKCTTLRSTTEWPETFESGWNCLWGGISNAEDQLIDQPFGAGDAADKISEALISDLK